MREIGNLLRNAREEQGLSVNDLHNRTKIRVRLIEALEEGDFSEIPGGMVYVRGFLRSLSEELNLDYLALSAMLGKDDAKPVTAALLAGVTPRKKRFSLAWVVLIVVGLLAVGGAYVMFRDREPPVEPPQVTEPPAVTPEPDPEPKPDPEPEPEAPEPTLRFVSESGERRVYEVSPWPVELVLMVERDSCWFRITGDGDQLTSATFRAGQSATYTAETEMTVRLGNPRVVRLTVNGLPLGTLTDRVRDYVFIQVSP